MTTPAAMQETLAGLRQQLHETERQVAQAEEDLAVFQTGKAGPVTLTQDQVDSIESSLEAIVTLAPALSQALGNFLTP